MVGYLRILCGCSALCISIIAGAITPDVDDFTVWTVSPDTIAVDDTVNEQQHELIFGPSIIDPATMHAFVAQHNPDFPLEIAEAFYRLGALYGIRGDVALCQSIIETGWFLFGGGTAVTPDQHNYCGMGVTSLGVKGSCFDTVDDGVRAQLQHIYAYATRQPLPEGETLVDPRFSLVNRGVATTWHDLSNRWAMNPDYGRHILDIYARLVEFSLSR